MCKDNLIVVSFFDSKIVNFLSNCSGISPIRVKKNLNLKFVLNIIRIWDSMIILIDLLIFIYISIVRQNGLNVLFIHFFKFK